MTHCINTVFFVLHILNNSVTDFIHNILRTFLNGKSYPCSGYFSNNGSSSSTTIKYNAVEITGTNSGNYQFIV